ncbi:MAG: sigma-54 dependent transcriptional regulator [Myxococcota bacterium]
MDPTDPCVLLVDADPVGRRALERTLVQRGYPVATAASRDDALRVALRREVLVAVIDLGLADGLDTIRALREVRPTAEYVALTEGDPGIGEAALHAGASDWFEKPIADASRFFQVVRRACEVQHLRRTIEMLEPRVVRPPRILGTSAATVRIRELVDRMAGATAPVLVTGESGVGKEVVAEALHEQGRRRGEFVRINCAALPESLIEAELFGAEEGTFTGQKGRRDGLFGLAENGTLFLDEIGEMPIGLQPKLLRVLQSLRYRPLGSRTERELTARVIAATNIDLHKAIGRGAFREDLYFRLNVLTIHVPPLRDRPEDVPLLASHFARKFAATEGRAGIEISDEAMHALEAYDWPGNVRELANTVLRAIVLTNGRRIGVEELGLATHRQHHPPETDGAALPDGWEAWMRLPLAEAKAEATAAFVAAYLARKLEESHGNVTRAAALAGVQRPNFKREMRKYGVGVVEEEDELTG